MTEKIVLRFSKGIDTGTLQKNIVMGESFISSQQSLQLNFIAM